jgi:hypothetical protein
MLAEVLEELTQLLEYSLAPVKLVLAVAALVEQVQQARLVLQTLEVVVVARETRIQAHLLVAQEALALSSSVILHTYCQRHQQLDHQKHTLLVSIGCINSLLTAQ